MSLAEIRERAVEERIAWLTAIYELSHGSTVYVFERDINTTSNASNPSGARDYLARTRYVRLKPSPSYSTPQPSQYGLTSGGLERIEAHIDAFDEDAIAVIIFEEGVIEAARAMKLSDADELAKELETEPLTAERFGRLKDMGLKVGTTVTTKLVLQRLGLD